MNFRSKDFFASPDMISCCVAPTFVSPVRVSLYDHTFKWGLNYKFYDQQTIGYRSKYSRRNAQIGG